VSLAAISRRHQGLPTGNGIRAKLKDRIEAQLAALKRIPRLVRSFFQAPDVAYITGW
jgi:hypothetical protein